MAREPFPTRRFGGNLSEDVRQANHTADASAMGAAAIADGARDFSRTLKGLADKAFEREGLRDAAEAIEAGDMIGVEPRIRTGTGVDDQAFNTAVREQLLARRATGFGEALEAARIANPDSLTRFEEAAAAVETAFRKPTGDPALDLALTRSISLQRSEARNRVRAGEERKRIEVARGAFVEATTAAQTTLGQMIGGAGFDEPGAARVGEALTQFYERLARFGPREAFTVGGVEFAADPTRADAMSAQELATLAANATVTARMSWIENAAALVADPMAKRALIGQVRERWEAGDPAFVGLDAADMDRLDARLEANASRAEADRAASMTAAGQAARDMLQAGEYGGAVDPEQLRQLAAASGDVGLQAQAEFALAYGFDVTPASLRSASGAASGFSGAVEFLLDDLEGSGFVGNDNGAGRSQFGITERSHPAAWRDGRVDRAEAAAIYRREYWDAIGGDRLPEDLGIAALATAAVSGAGVARQLIEASGGDVERFLALELQRFERLAAQDPAQYGDDLDGWRARQGKVRGMIQRARAMRRARDGYASDPVGYARGADNRAPLASVAEFDAAGGFVAGNDEWAAAIRQRRAQGQALSRRDGVPARILDNEEASFYKSQIEADPARIVPLAANAVRALGPEGARDFFADLGRAGLAGADLHLGWLATQPRMGNVVTMAVEGRVLRAGGAREAAFGDEESIEQALPRFAEALGADPAVTPAIAQLARDMAIADAARGRLRRGGYYLNAALGATDHQGAVFGGLATVNGGRTVAPTWLQVDRLDDALDIAADLFAAQDRGPRYENGAPMEAWVMKRHRLRAEPDGTYALINPRTGRPVPGRDGRPFRMDFEREDFRGLLNRRLPGAVRER